MTVLKLMLSFLLQGDADIFFPTDFWLLEQIDHYCSGWLKPHGDHPSKKGKKRRTITVSSIVLLYIHYCHISTIKASSK